MMANQPSLATQKKALSGFDSGKVVITQVVWIVAIEFGNWCQKTLGSKKMVIGQSQSSVKRAAGAKDWCGLYTLNIAGATHQRLMKLATQGDVVLLPVTANAKLEICMLTLKYVGSFHRHSSGVKGII